MQEYTEIPAENTLQISRAQLLDNDKTIMSNSSGTTFPTVNIYVGMMCYRTDLKQVYALRSVGPSVWILFADLNKTATNKEYVDSTFAPLISPVITGTPTAPTQTAGDNSTKLATTAFVTTAVAPKAPLASPVFTGSPTVPDQALGTNSSVIANTKFVFDGLALKANLASPAFSGTPTAPTQLAGDNSGKLATTAYVDAAVTTTPNATKWAGSSKTVSTGTPSGGVDGDFWFQY